jgi:hypothetical protein
VYVPRTQAQEPRAGGHARGGSGEDRSVVCITTIGGGGGGGGGGVGGVGGVIFVRRRSGESRSGCCGGCRDGVDEGEGVRQEAALRGRPGRPRAEGVIRRLRAQPCCSGAS